MVKVLVSSLDYVPQLPSSFTPEILTEIIRSEQPELIINQVRSLNNGWDHAVLEINDEYIVRFPKKLSNKLAIELKSLEFLKGKITLPIPTVLFTGRKYPYMGYKKIPGIIPTEEIIHTLPKAALEQFSQDIALFLHEIHQAISLEAARDLHLPKTRHDLELETAYTLLPKLQDPAIYQFVENTLNEFAEILTQEPELTTLFNDLHEENIAFSPTTNRIVGIFDFSDLATGDIHTDFRDFYLLDRQLLELIVQQYEKLSDRKLLLRTIVMHSRFNELQHLAHYLDDPAKHYFTDRAKKRINLWIREKDLYV